MHEWHEIKKWRRGENGPTYPKWPDSHPDSFLYIGIKVWRMDECGTGICSKGECTPNVKEMVKKRWRWMEYMSYSRCTSCQLGNNISRTHVLFVGVS